MEDRLDRVRPVIRTRQYRDFTDEPVADEDLFALTEVARWSGSSTNSQPWRFVVIRDVQTIRHIAVIGHNQTRSMHTAMAVVAIVMPPDEQRAVSRAYDEGRVAERVLIAAGLLGLGAGIAWITSDVRPEIAQLLQLPEGHYVRTMLSVGHPSAQARAPKAAPGQARLPRDQVVMDDHWR